jgi:hypothetical protein
VRIIQMMLRSWSGGCGFELDWMFVDKSLGLMYFCMDNMLAIRSLIDTLRIPSLETRVSLIFPSIRILGRQATDMVWNRKLFSICFSTY